MELQDGDILGIDDYQLLVNDIHAASSASVVAKPAAKAAIIFDEPATVLSSSTAAIPSEIWDSLAKEFSISDDLSQRQKPAPASSEAHPLTVPDPAERNPENPLAALISDAPLNIGQQPTHHS